jgi:putative ABC transport system permease protein
MKNELKLPFYLAFQSIRRGRKWTLILTIILMAVAFINLIFVSALFNGIVQGSNQQVINTLTGNIYVSPKQGTDSIGSISDVIKNIKNISGVNAVTSGFQVPARIERDSNYGIWPVTAINPMEYARVINVSQKMFSGKYLNENDVDKIIIGRQIAGGKDVELNSSSLKGASVGDKVEVTFNGLKKTFTIKGIFYTKFTESDARAFITEKALESMDPSLNNKATVINIKSSSDKQDYILSQLRLLYPSLESYPWSEAAGVMKSVSSSFVSINILMTFVGAVIAAVTTFIVIYVDIINRRRQIGILRAIGIRPYIIVSSYVILAAVYATLGIVLGSLIFYFGLVPYFIAHPFELPIASAVLNLTWIDYIARVEIVSWVAVISGFIPAIIVTRAKMLDTIIGK